MFTVHVMTTSIYNQHRHLLLCLPYRYSIMNTEMSGHAQLHIRITFPEDLGEYTCTLRNDAGEATTIGLLVSEGKLALNTFLHHFKSCYHLSDLCGNFVTYLRSFFQIRM